MMNRFLTSKEASDYLGLSEAELQEMVEKGSMPSYKIGGIYTRFKVNDLDIYRKRYPAKQNKDAYPSFLGDKIKDFFYFNDFYICSILLITAILFFIFR